MKTFVKLKVFHLKFFYNYIYIKSEIIIIITKLFQIIP